MELTIDDYMQVWKQKFEEQEKQIQQARSIKHDMQAHMIVLQYYLEDEKYEAAKAYLKDMRNTQLSLQLDRDIEVGNALVNVLLKEYMKKSKEDIVFSCKGELPEEIKVTDYDWCTVFSNLMSNAIEACEKLKNSKKTIRLEISTDEQKIYVVMENPIEWNVEKTLFENQTTKEDKTAHGYGLKNVKKVVEKYKGKLEYICGDGLFAVKISFPIKGVE